MVCCTDVPNDVTTVRRDLLLVHFYEVSLWIVDQLSDVLHE